ncbi:MAG: FAD-binding protein [Bilophila wadsworthia]
MLGGGTNILAADGEVPVVLVRCGMDEAPAVIGEDGGLRLVRVGAGVKLPRLLVWCMKHGLSGLEGMAGVPGDVGGAVAGNAGAHGMDRARKAAQRGCVFPGPWLSDAGA